MKNSNKHAKLTATESRREELAILRANAALRKLKEAHATFENLAQEAHAAQDWPMFETWKHYAYSIGELIESDGGESGLNALIKKYAY